MRTNFVPVYPTSIATDNLRDVLQRQGFGVDTKVLVEFGVHLMLGEPEGEHGHLVREVEQFDAIELTEADDAVIHKQDFTLRGTFALQREDIHLEETQTLVGDDEEVATTASRIEELHAAHALQQGIATLLDLLTFLVELLCGDGPDILHLTLLLILLIQAVVLASQFVHKQRIDNLHDVGH